MRLVSQVVDCLFLNRRADLGQSLNEVLGPLINAHVNEGVGISEMSCLPKFERFGYRVSVSDY